jgi:hypothetical protein
MKRLSIVIVLVLVVVLGCSVVLFLRSREPRYQGQTLSAWLTVVGDSDAAEFQAAKDALKHMSPKAIPFLLKWLRKKDSPLNEGLAQWLDDHARIHFHIEPASDYHMRARVGFSLLGTNALSAWPVLIRWTYDPDEQVRLNALGCLMDSGADAVTAVPVLLRLINDPDGEVQLLAGRFHESYPEQAQSAGVYAKFPYLKDYPTVHSGHNQETGENK